MAELILASASEARARMLTLAGLEFDTIAARVDEAAIRSSLEAEGAGARDIADALAEAKALKLSSRYPSALVIGADQTLEFEGEVMGKPSSADALRAQLVRFKGRRHSLFSAAVVAEGGRPLWRHVQEARMHVRSMSDSWLDAYIARNWDAVRGSVGGYLIEAEGVRLFDRVDGDTFAIMGLPLVPLLSWLSIRGSIPG